MRGVQGIITSPSLVYEGQQESLYFQGEPPKQFRVEEDLGRPPMACLVHPIHPGQPHPACESTYKHLMGK